MKPEFQYFFRVRYGECDAQKVVFNARYGDYIDISITEFLRALGYGAEMASSVLDFQLVKQTTQWRAPAHYDDVIAASVRCTHVGNTSWALNCELRRAGESEILCESETVYVLMDHETMNKKKIPDEFRAALEAGAPGQYSDHAGYRAEPDRANGG